ncbi:MAG: SRPBCC family protein [Solirubrobacterales bacterium]|nr:SRPBCC family protein [Solirubrobacterales bacterium]
MAIHGSATETINAPIEAVYAVAADVENSPAWQPEIKDAEVLKRDKDGNQVLVRTKSDARVKTVTSELEFSYDEPNGLSWKQKKGDMKSVEGSWTLEDLGDGTTKATYEMTVDMGRGLGMLIRGPLVDLLRGQMVDTMPGKLKGYVEDNS